MQFDEIFSLFAENKVKGFEAQDQANVDLAKRLHEELCEYGFDYPLAIFSTIGYSYVENAQMNERIEKFGKGTARIYVMLYRSMWAGCRINEICLIIQ